MIFEFKGISRSINQFADYLANAANRALITEVRITPKPGLVDEANNGAHDDMGIDTFLVSADALIPYFHEITLKTLNFSGSEKELLPSLRPIGILAEERMFKTTNGVNTHKGAIYSLGILCIAVALLVRSNKAVNPESLQKTCLSLASGENRDIRTQSLDFRTNGVVAYKKHGITGISGEAAAGFPHLFDIALPKLSLLLESGCTLNDAGVISLLHLIAKLDDTNIISRCGIEALRDIKTEVSTKISKFESNSQYLDYAYKLDREFIDRNISPGGSADILAGTLFVYSIIS